MTEIAVSRHGVPIRLTDERWAHILEEHAELNGQRQEVLATVSAAERVLAGNEAELFAIRMVAQDRALVVVYKEPGKADGFVITAFLTSQVAKLERRQQLWPQPPSQIT